MTTRSLNVGDRADRHPSNQDRGGHRAILLILPDFDKNTSRVIGATATGDYLNIESYSSLISALREVVEEQWECELLLESDKYFSNIKHENIRMHLEQADAYIAEVTDADPDVMYLLGAANFFQSHCPCIILTKTQNTLPRSLLGRQFILYECSHQQDLVHYLEAELSRNIHFIQTVKTPVREHFISISKLQKIVALQWFNSKTWRELQNTYPTREAWQNATANKVASIVDGQMDVAEIILKRIYQWLEM
jgi:molecular chaperone HtpG